MTYYYKGKEIGDREDTMEFIMALPYNELYYLVHTYLDQFTDTCSDQFTEEHLKDIIWASADNRDKNQTITELVENALTMMENDWKELHDTDSLEEEEVMFIGYLEYENWEEEE